MQGYRLIKPGDREWPIRMDDMHSVAPIRELHVEGGTLGEYESNIAIVGTRTATVAGLEIADRLARGFAEAGFTVVSGLARGIDTAAHRASLNAQGNTIAVLGTGLDVYYPKRNEGLQKKIASAGTLVTEYEFGSSPVDWHFPLRNRIIVGLSKTIVVIEGGPRSGALITARLGLDANRCVFAVPGSVRNVMSEGPNELIRTANAGLVTKVEHVLEEVAPELVWKAEDGSYLKRPPKIEPEESDVLHLLDDAPVTDDVLLQYCSLKPGRLALVLAKLEIRGLARKVGAGYAITSAGGRARDLSPGAPRQEELVSMPTPGSEPE